MAKPPQSHVLKRIEDRVSRLEQDLKTKKTLSQLDQKWMVMKRCTYKKDPQNIHNSIVTLLNRLNPYLGYDWRVGPSVKAELKAKGVDLEGLPARLKQGLSLNAKELAWISLQRKAYLKKPERFPEFKTEFLDQLQPYLGYDWRIPNGSINKVTVVNTAKIAKALTTGQPVPKAMKRWLIVQKERYHERPERFSTIQLKALEELTPVLGCSWTAYIGDQDKQVEDLLREMETLLQNGNPLTERCRYWLYAQRATYKLHANTYPPERKARLDALNPLLGYDWKVPKLEKRTTNITERTVFIKAYLAKGKPLESQDKSWLEGRRRAYAKNKAQFTKAEVKHLNTLNPFLELPWYLTKREQRRQLRTFTYYIEQITALQKPFKELPEPYKDWVLDQRKAYHNNKAAFSPKALQQLDGLTPIIKRQWNSFPKTTYNVVQFEKRYAEIKQKLQQGVPLDVPDKKYLMLKRKQHHEGRFKDPKAIERLDQLNALLGYDWKAIRSVQNKSKSFKEHFKDISKILKAFEALNKTQREFLRKQRVIYQKSPKTYPRERYDALEMLIPYLGYDWKVKQKHYGEKLNFEDRAKCIKRQLKNGKLLTIEEKDWLRKHRLIYRKDPKAFDKKRQYILEDLIPVLGYDWKTYKRERDAELTDPFFKA